MGGAGETTVGRRGGASAGRGVAGALAKVGPDPAGCGERLCPELRRGRLSPAGLRVRTPRSFSPPVGLSKGMCGIFSPTKTVCGTRGPVLPGLGSSVWAPNPTRWREFTLFCRCFVGASLKLEIVKAGRSPGGHLRLVLPLKTRNLNPKWIREV